MSITIRSNSRRAKEGEEGSVDLTEESKKNDYNRSVEKSIRSKQKQSEECFRIFLDGEKREDEKAQSAQLLDGLSMIA